MENLMFLLIIDSRTFKVLLIKYNERLNESFKKGCRRIGELLADLMGL
jgi:hypothetical protein